MRRLYRRRFACQPDACVGCVRAADSRNRRKGICPQLPNDDADAEAAGCQSRQLTSVDKRAAAFARLFQGVQVGAYIGVIGPDATSTVAANPHLKLIFGYGGETPDAEVRPFDRDRFVDQQARDALVERLVTDGSVVNYLLRLRRADRTVIWVELTGRVEAERTRREFRIE